MESRSNFDRLFLALLAGLIGLYIAAFCYYVVATQIRAPVYDHIAWILHYARHWQAGDRWNYLWLPHNEHRIVWSRLLILADIEWYRGNSLPFLIFDSACFLLTVGCLLWEIRCASLPTELRAYLAAVVILLLVASHAAVDCSVPIMGVYVQTTGFFVLALALLDGAGEEGRGTRGRRLAAVACAVLAVFGLAGGLLAPLVLLWCAWAARLNRAWLVAIGAVSGLAIALYLPGIPMSADANSLAWTDLPRLLDYYVRLLGLPWSHVPSLIWFGRVAGGAVLGAGIATVLWRGVLHRPTGRLERIGVGLLLFALAVAAMAAVARSSVAPERPMPIRYGIFAALAEAGLLLASVPWIARVWQKSGKRQLQWATVAAASVLLVQQIAGGQAAIAVTNQYNDSYRRFAAGQWTPEMEHYVYPDRAEAENAREIMQRLQIYQ